MKNIDFSHGITIWGDDEGEAGNHVEVHSQGGIISFDHDW